MCSIERTGFNFEGAMLSVLVPKMLLAAPQQHCKTAYVPQYSFPLPVRC